MKYKYKEIMMYFLLLFMTNGLLNIMIAEVVLPMHASIFLLLILCAIFNSIIFTSYLYAARNK